MKIAIVSFRSISEHPTHVLSADYWVNIQAGKLPFNKVGGTYSSISHTKDLSTATWLFLHEARELNIALNHVKKAEKMLNEAKKKHNLLNEKEERELNKAELLSIRRLRSRKATYRDIAERIGISVERVKEICKLSPKETLTRLNKKEEDNNNNNIRYIPRGLL